MRKDCWALRSSLPSLHTAWLGLLSLASVSREPTHPPHTIQYQSAGSSLGGPGVPLLDINMFMHSGWKRLCNNTTMQQCILSLSSASWSTVPCPFYAKAIVSICHLWYQVDIEMFVVNLTWNGNGPLIITIYYLPHLTLKLLVKVIYQNLRK